MKLPQTFRAVQLLPRKLLFGLIAAMGLLVGIGYLSYLNIERQADAAKWVGHTSQVVESLRGVFSTVQELDNAQRLFVTTGSELSALVYAAAEGALPGLFGATGNLLADNPAQRLRLTNLRDDVEKRIVLARTRMAQRRELGAGALDARFLSGASGQMMETIRADVATMTLAENSLLEDRLRALERVRQRGLLLQTIGGLASLLLLGVVFAGLANQMGRASRAEQEAQRSNVQLKDSNNELRAFSYSVAHDLRTPLRAISGYGQVLVEDHGEKLDDEGRRVVMRIVANAKMMAQLIDDLLALSKISYQPLRSNKVEMNGLVRSAYQELSEANGGRIVQCEIGDLPPAVGDENLLRQVWINLIANALKFTRQRPQARIEIGGNMAGPEFATYFIRDNGAGFDMQYVSKLFGAFQRLHRPTDFEGTGIGLALVQRIVHRHGGTIWAEGKENEGARFAFTLPEWKGAA